MRRLAALLDEHPGVTVGGWGSWHDRVAHHLAGPRGATLEGEDAELVWVALGWVELSASRVVQTMDDGLLRLGIAFLAVIDDAEVLDRRDVQVVGGLLRRACELIGSRIEVEVEAVRLLPHRGVGGSAVLDWLGQTPPPLNTLHAEVGEGSSFLFVREPTSADVELLEAWFGDP